MKTSHKLSTLLLPWILLGLAAPIALGSTLTLGTAPGNSAFVADDWLIAGATVTDGPTTPAEFEAFSWWDKNNDGVWNGPDARRRAYGIYNEGIFGLYAQCTSLGAFSAQHQYVTTRGILIIDDLMITSSDPTPLSTVPTSISFHVSGGTSHFTNAAHPEVVGASLNLRVVLNGSVNNGVYSWLQYKGDPETTVTGLATQIAAGTFAENFNAVITTGTVNVPVNTPFTLHFEVVVSASVGGGSGSAYGGMIFDARNTAGFLPGATIFNGLPPGYTVESQSVGIAGNTWGGSPVAIEPSTWSGIKSLYR